MGVEIFRQITEGNNWQDELSNILALDSFPAEYVSAFHTYWIVAGHRIRSQIANDKLLAKLLRHVLPKYDGSELNLYRGENTDRWESKQLGFCWSQSIEVARMFARGLNSVGNGGVLLSCNCKPAWIISGPNEHSRWLQEEEYTVDPSLVLDVKVISKFAPSQ